MIKGTVIILTHNGCMDVCMDTILIRTYIDEIGFPLKIQNREILAWRRLCHERISLTTSLTTTTKMLIIMPGMVCTWIISVSCV